MNCTGANSFFNPSSVEGLYTSPRCVGQLSQLVHANGLVKDETILHVYTSVSAAYETMQSKARRKHTHRTDRIDTGSLCGDQAYGYSNSNHAPHWKEKGNGEPGRHLRERKKPYQSLHAAVGTAQLTPA